MIDTQQQRLYDAEAVLEDYAQHLHSLEEIAAFITATLNKPAIKRRYAPWLRFPIAVELGEDGDTASASSRSIRMPVWAWNGFIALHEAAHVLAQRIYGRTRIEAHGEEYAAVYLDLVRYGLGPLAQAALLRSFERNHVRYGGSAPPIHDTAGVSFKVKACSKG